MKKRDKKTGRYGGDKWVFTQDMADDCVIPPDLLITKANRLTMIDGGPGPEIVHIEPGKLIPFDEGFFMAGTLPPPIEAMIEQDNANRAAAERQRFITLGEHEAEIKRIDDQLSAAFGQRVTVRIMIEAEQARQAFKALGKALRDYGLALDDARAQALWPWLAYGLVLVLAILTALVIGKP